MTVYFQSIFADDFTSWDAAETDGTSTITIDSTVPHTGTKCAKSATAAIASAYANRKKELPSSYDLVYYGSYHRFGTLPAVGQTIYFHVLDMDNLSYDDYLAVRLTNVAGNIFWELHATIATVGTTFQEAVASNPVANKYYWIETMHDKVNQIQRLWVSKTAIDATLKVSGNAAITRQGRRLREGIYWTANDNTANVLYADRVIAANEYIGPAGSASLRARHIKQIARGI